MSDPIEVFLQDFHGFALLVQAPTGVTYRHQCGGALCDQRSAEGYLVPCDPYVPPQAPGTPQSEVIRGEKLALRLVGGIEAGQKSGNFRGLTQMLASLRVYGPKRRWHDAEWGALAFDDNRATDALEAWIPVLSPYGLGYLIWENSD
jgi:hypothetical protein